MGIDALDITFRIERAFGDIKIPRGLLFENDIVGKHTTVTVGDIHARVCRFLRASGRAVPENSWDIVAQCVGEALKLTPHEIRPEHRLIDDLGAS